MENRWIIITALEALRLQECVKMIRRRNPIEIQRRPGPIGTGEEGINIEIRGRRKRTGLREKRKKKWRVATPFHYLLYHKNAIMNPMIAWNSISASAMIIGVKTLSAEVGLRAIPERAASAARP